MGTQTRPISPAWMSTHQGAGQLAARGGESTAAGIAAGFDGLVRGVNTITRKREDRAKQAWLEGEHALDRTMRRDLATKSLDLRKWELQARRDEVTLKHFGNRVRDLEEEGALMRLMGDTKGADAKKAEAMRWSQGQDTVMARMGRPPVADANLEAMRAVTRGGG